MTKALTRSSPHVGELLTFNVIVANQGPSPATGVAVTEVLSAGLAFESAAPSQGAYDSATGLWTVGALANGGSAGLTITARVTQAGTVTNTASVTASDQPDPDPTDNTASVTADHADDRRPGRSPRRSPGHAIPGLATTYTIVVTNLGPSPVTAASVTDTFPAAFVSPTWTCVADAGSTCVASGTGNLATTVTLEAGDACHVHRDRHDRGERDRPARQHGDRHGAGRRRRWGYHQQHGDQFGDADALRRRSRSPRTAPLTAVAGTNVVYTITVTNAGPSDATGVTLTDPTPTGLTFVSNAGDCTTAFPCTLGTLPPAATRTITATFAVPSGYTTPNPITNTATVSSPTPDRRGQQRARPPTRRSPRR